MRGKAIFLAASTTVSLVAGCGSGEPELLVVARDSAGVAIVDNGHPLRPGVARWRLSAEPRVVIGRDEGTAGPLLMEVVGGYLLDDRGVVVGDRGSGEVHFFDHEGDHLRTVGGPGEGPGEFRILVALDRLPGDTIVAGAWPLGLRVWWSADGTYLTNSQSGRWGPGLVGGRSLPDGTFLIDTYEGGSHGNSLELWAARGEESTFRTRGVLLRLARDGTPLDTIGFVFGEEWFKSGELRVNFAMSPRPFTYRTYMGFSSDRIYLGESHIGEIRAYDLHGALLRRIRWEPEPTPITRADRRAFRQRTLDRLNNPARRPDYERWLSEVAYPETKPAFRSFVIDRMGRAWVQAWTATEGLDRWLVFSHEGVLEATLDAPSNFLLLDAGSDYALVVERDELDVQTVQLFDLLEG